MATSTVSKQTRNNYLIDVFLFLGAVVSILTGIYFLFLPVAGYQGGRNPTYGINILFARETWDDLHTWFGILMILAAAVHIVIHWNWIVNMTRRAWQELSGNGKRFNARSRYNVLVNMGIGLSFLLTAVSGVVLLFVEGGRHGFADPLLIFSRTTWDLIHTWAGIALILVAALHFAIHWGWIVKVSSKMIGALLPASSRNPAVEPVKVNQS